MIQSRFSMWVGASQIQHVADILRKHCFHDVIITSEHVHASIFFREEESVNKRIAETGLGCYKVFVYHQQSMPNLTHEPTLVYGPLD